MKRSQENIHNRRDKLFHLLLEHGSINVADAAELLNVSQLTIRRDLDFFEEKRLIDKYYGGAKLVDKSSPIDANQRLELIKQEIAKKAAEFVASGDVIFINTSSTATYLLKYLENKEVTVITNNAKVLRSIISPNTSIIFTGGELRSPKHSMVGDYALQMLDSIKSTNNFLGASGVNLKEGMSTSVHSEVSINKKMIERTNGGSFLLVDHTKFSHNARFFVDEISAFTTIITDDLVEQELIEEFKHKTGINIVQVSTKNIGMV